MEHRIYYHHTDAGGVVYYGTYLQFLEEARTEFLEQKGIKPGQLHKDGFLYAVRQCNITYKSPARYGDTIVCKTHLINMTAAQLFFKQEIFNKNDERLLVSADVTLVSLTADFKPNPIPVHIKTALEV